MPLARYMALCLDPSGARLLHAAAIRSASSGDFTTAPEISQMFGELIGLWAASVWQSMGAPASINLVELGPGRGTMMADALRAAKVVPAFEQAITVHLVETSPVLRDIQRLKLGEIDEPVTWHESVEDRPGRPAIIVANEFFDALADQSGGRRRTAGTSGRWRSTTDGELAFSIAADPLHEFRADAARRPSAMPRSARCSNGARSLRRIELARRIKRGGAALIIDYGHVQSDVGVTFQAVRNHRYDDPLDAPGLADLSAHVDFEALADAAASIGRARPRADRARAFCKASASRSARSD